MFDRITKFFGKVKELEARNKYLEKKLDELDNKNFELEEDLQEQKDLYSELEEQFIDMQEAYKDPRLAVEHIFGKELTFYRYENLSKGAMLQYQANAASLKRNEVLYNEKNFLAVNEAKKALANTKDFQEVRDIRMFLLGMATLIERIESIPEPDTAEQKREKTRDEEFSETLELHEAI